MSNSQGGFTGQFDNKMGLHSLVGRKTKLQHFRRFQQALSNTVSSFCREQPEDVKYLIKHLVEVVINKPEELTKDILRSTSAAILVSNYSRKMDRWEKRTASYTTNKSIICGIVLGQCSPAMQAKLVITAGWEANKSDLLWVLKAAQPVCISVQENYSHHVVGREAMQSLTICSQNSSSNLNFKEDFLACTKMLEKAEIGFVFGKKFLDAEKKRDPNLNDATAHEAATHRFLGTLWLLNSAAPETLKNNLVQAYITGDDRYPADIE